MSAFNKRQRGRVQRHAAVGAAFRRPTVESSALHIISSNETSKTPSPTKNVLFATGITDLLLYAGVSSPRNAAPYIVSFEVHLPFAGEQLKTNG